MQTALSIQSHPDKKLAEKLHAQNPKVGVSSGSSSGTNATAAAGTTAATAAAAGAAAAATATFHATAKGTRHIHPGNCSSRASAAAATTACSCLLACTVCSCALLAQDYKDDNHKPEMALALRDFSALCGFVTLPEVQAALRAHSELRGVVGPAADKLLEAGEGGYKEVSGGRRDACWGWWVGGRVGGLGGGWVGGRVVEVGFRKRSQQCCPPADSIVPQYGSPLPSPLMLPTSLGIHTPGPEGRLHVPDDRGRGGGGGCHPGAGGAAAAGGGQRPGAERQGGAGADAQPAVPG